MDNSKITRRKKTKNNDQKNTQISSIKFPTSDEEETKKGSCILKYNVVQRTIFTFFMLSMFLYLINRDKIFLATLTLLIQVLVFKEVVFSAFTLSKFSFFSKYLIFHFFIACNIFIFHKFILSVFSDYIPSYIKDRYWFICFIYYIVGFCLFTFSLRKKSLKKQFYVFAVTHVTTVLIGKSAQVAIHNLMRGKFWFVFPAILVIINDIAAYIFGKLFGKRPLYRLSPKKTVEGFLGGFFATFVIGITLTKYVFKYHLANDDLRMLFSRTFALYLFGSMFYIPIIYIHVFFFILFASFFAPFGGFFASAFKRALKIKDFGTIIPGHGGIADRMDCQFMMACFTNVYINTFIFNNVMSVEGWYYVLKKNLTDVELQKLKGLLTTIE